MCSGWVFWRQWGLNTHRVNIIGLNPVWVDIGLVSAWDFIFLSPTLVFAGCDLNSIGVICLSKAKTGTCRSWVCAHWNQGNSIRCHPCCVWGRNSSVAMVGGRGIRVVWLYIRGLHHFSKDFSQWLAGWGVGVGGDSQMSAFKDAVSAHPSDQRGSPRVSFPPSGPAWAKLYTMSVWSFFSRHRQCTLSQTNYSYLLCSAKLSKQSELQSQLKSV